MPWFLFDDFSKTEKKPPKNKQKKKQQNKTKNNNKKRRKKTTTTTTTKKNNNNNNNNMDVGDARTISAFHFRYAHFPVTIKNCAVVAAIPATTSHCVRTYDVLSVDYFISAVRVQAHTQWEWAGRRGWQVGANAPTSSAKYLKLMQFSPETEFKLPSSYVFSYFPFGFEGRMWDLMYQFLIIAYPFTLHP